MSTRNSLAGTPCGKAERGSTVVTPLGPTLRERVRRVRARLVDVPKVLAELGLKHDGPHGPVLHEVYGIETWRTYWRAPCPWVAHRGHGLDAEVFLGGVGAVICVHCAACMGRTGTSRAPGRGGTVLDLIAGSTAPRLKMRGSDFLTVLRRGEELADGLQHRLREPGED